MKPHTYFAVLLILAGCSPVSASTHHRSSAHLDVFESFRLLDTQFTKLDAEFRTLQESMTNSGRRTGVKRPWRDAARQMRDTTAHIERLSTRMTARYRRSKRKLGYHMFLLLRRDAQQLHARLVPIVAAPSQARARRESLEARRRMLDLVLQYQAISGGYAAAQCDAGEWTCGNEKSEPRSVGYPRIGVKWVCVKRAAACKGILGSPASKLASQPLTANTKIPTGKR